MPLPRPAAPPLDLPAPDLTPDPRSAAGMSTTLSQLRYFRSLNLHEKLQAVEGMADLVRHLQQIRAQGGFKPASRQADEPGATHPSRNPQVADALLMVAPPWIGNKSWRGGASSPRASSGTSVWLDARHPSRAPCLVGYVGATPSR
ncbi:MAG: hypothetical protein ACT4QB_21880 [Gammaproteobacteria bacterium]